MTQLIEVTYVCAVCGEKVGFMGLGSTNSFGKPDLDMRPPGMERSTLGIDYQLCGNCGYVSYTISAPVSDRVKNYVLSPEYQKKAAEEVPHDYIHIKRYRNMCDILLYDQKYSEAFHAIMNAAWAADDISDNDCAVKLRKEALYLLENTPAKDHFTADTLTLLTADLYRRIGNFDEVIDLCSDYQTENPFIVDSLAYERELAAKKDTAAHEVRYEREEDNYNKWSEPED